MTSRYPEFVVCVGTREVWRGPARGHCDATDQARTAHTELRDVDLNSTSVEPAVAASAGDYSFNRAGRGGS